MPKLIEEIPLVAFNLNYNSDIPLYKQLYELLRRAILDGKINPGKRLPGTRSLATELNISRNTVAIAFDQLKIEGYLSGKTGSGYFINEIPDNSMIAKEKSGQKVIDRSAKPLKKKRLWRWNNKLAGENIFQRNFLTERMIPFQNGAPALNEFPIRTWIKIINRASLNISNLHLGYGDAAGFKPLREAVASYLQTYRAVNCTSDQVVIVNGSQQGLDLIGRILLRKVGSVSVPGTSAGRNVWLEDPGYFGVRASMINVEASIYPCPIDEEGFNLDYSIKHNPKPDLIYTTPSHQFPLGQTMSVSRRIQLLNYAKKNKCWILEDDYDSEFRYMGNPLPSLQGMDKNKTVIYLGTFSKVLVPGLRLGYLVLPDDEMLEVFRGMKFITDRQSPILEQLVLADYLKEGHFTKHIRKMRMLYKSRQEFLINEIKINLNEFVDVKPSPSGMQIILWLKKKVSDKKVSAEALKNNLIVNALSDYSIKFHQKPGIILGYTAFNEKEIKEGVSKLKKVLVNI